MVRKVAVPARSSVVKVELRWEILNHFPNLVLATYWFRRESGLLWALC